MKKSSKRRPLKDGADMHSEDPLGSYTGVPAQGERPVQDADDL